MHLIRKGFDGLDISYPLTISEELADKMRLGRAVSEANNGEVGMVEHNGVRMQVAATGARGGYAFRCDSGVAPFGENWFFKQPNGKADKWGVRVSCRALPLAFDGLAKTRARLEDTLARLELDYVPGTESIGRVDVAFDILAPDLAPDRLHFVAHARSRVQEISDTLVQVVGRSGRVESITIGKNPNRQVVLYDKRAEVIATRKPYWWRVWNDALAAQGLPPLDPRNRDTSTVWRVEIRAFKRHLKDDWAVTTWGNLRDNLSPILQLALGEVRYTVPTADTNRARWPVHPLWALIAAAAVGDMEDLASMVDRSSIDALLTAERDEMLQKQIAGCSLSRAALNGVPIELLDVYALGNMHQIIREWQRNPDWTQDRLAQARAKYGVGEERRGEPEEVGGPERTLVRGAANGKFEPRLKDAANCSSGSFAPS